MVEGTGRIADGQAKSINVLGKLLPTVAGAPPPEEERAGQRQHQAGAVTPGTDGLAKLKDSHASPSQWI